jgi:hypothetical protein
MGLRSGTHVRFVRGGLAAATLAVLVAAPAGAQSASPAPGVEPVTALTVSTTYPSVEVDPGGEATFPLVVLSPQTERVDLTVSSVPDGFRATIRGGGSIVGSVTANPTTAAPLELRVDVPDAAAPGAYRVVVDAASAGGDASLPVDLIVADTSLGSVSLTTDYPALSGDSSAPFTFNLKLVNDTAQEVTFGLAGAGPEGWDVQVRPSGQDQAATAIVAAGSKANIKVTVTPDRYADAGRYPIRVLADGGEDHQAVTDLLVELTGSYAAKLDSSDGRLNTTVTAGSSQRFGVVIANTGTAPLAGVKLTATPPSGWSVTFDTDTIESIAVGETATATAVITPSGNAVAGDYVITMKAKADGVDQSIQVRTTVETSQTWGLVGIGLIVLVVLGLAVIFRRFGRR